MRSLVGEAETGPVVSTALVVGSIVVLTFCTVSDISLRQVVPVTIIVLVAAVWYQTLLAWRNLLALLIVVILFIPIRRYALPGDLPFQLEPYRLLVFLIVAAWVA